MSLFQSSISYLLIKGGKMQDIENEIRNLVAEIIEKDPSEIKPDSF